MPNLVGPLPPHARLNNFLPEDDHRRVLDWVLSNPDAFSPAVVSDSDAGAKYEVSPEDRTALTSKSLGPFEPMLRAHLLAAVDEIVASVGVPLSPESLDLEFSAYGDGAFFAPHSDISTGRNRRPIGGQPGHDRILSAVYYFHREPKAFSGGMLRLYRFGATPAADPAAANYVDLEPVNNSLVAFWSPVLHEVRPVRCPTAKFEDSRFALNCWYCRPL